MTLSYVRSGDPLSAAGQNLLVEQINALGRPGAVGQSQFGAAGVTFHAAAEARLALFELVDSVIYPELVGAAEGYFDRESTPYAQAKPVWYSQHQAADETATGEPIRSDQISDNPATTMIWFPLAPRNADGYAMGPPVAQVGTRLLALFNRQSGRWEALQGPPYYAACWAMLNQQLASGGSASARLWWGGGDSGLDVTAYDWLLPPGGNLPAGTKVKVEFFPQDGLWWVTAASC